MNRRSAVAATYGVSASTPDRIWVPEFVLLQHALSPTNAAPAQIHLFISLRSLRYVLFWLYVSHKDLAEFDMANGAPQAHWAFARGKHNVSRKRIILRI
jgi:hypothetical protein